MWEVTGITSEVRICLAFQECCWVLHIFTHVVSCIVFSVEIYLSQETECYCIAEMLQFIDIFLIVNVFIQRAKTAVVT